MVRLGRKKKVLTIEEKAKKAEAKEAKKNAPPKEEVAKVERASKRKISNKSNSKGEEGANTKQRGLRKKKEKSRPKEGAFVLTVEPDTNPKKKPKDDDVESKDVNKAQQKEGKKRKRKARRQKEKEVEAVATKSKRKQPLKKHRRSTGAKSKAVNFVKPPPPPPVEPDIKVHRLRHLDYLPKPIVCLQATPANASSSASSFVALSRDTGSVELKAPNEKFRTICEIAGYKHKVVNSMAWTCGVSSSSYPTANTPISDKNSSSDNYCRPTLVGGSRDGTLFVVDFATGAFTGMTASGGGGVFCLTSLCQHHQGRCCSGKSKECAQLVAAGCEDGSIRIWKVVDHRKLELVSILPSASGASIVSLAWRKTASGHGSVLFCGISDGTIRRYDCEDAVVIDSGDALVISKEGSTNPRKTRTYDASAAGSWKSRLRITVENLGRNTSTQVWALHALADGTLVSGDSLGHVQFWDGDTGTLLQSFEQNDNKADVLELAVASEENKIFATGIDSRVVCIERPNLAASAAGGAVDSSLRRWILSSAQRPHTHDVKGMTVCRQLVIEDDTRTRKLSVLNDSPSHEVLCTGGIDTKMCTYYVEGYKQIRPMSLYPWPAFSPVVQANEARIIALRREGQVDLYQLASNEEEEDEDDDDEEDSPRRRRALEENDSNIGSIQLDSACNLVAVAISDDGKYLAACDPLALLVFRVEYVTNEEGTISMIPTKLVVDTQKIKGSIVSMKFGDNDQLVAAASDGSVHVINMPEDEEVARDGQDEEGEDENDEESEKVKTLDDICTHAMALKQKKTKAQHKDALFPVQAIAFSKDKTWFATLQGGQDCSSIRIFSREEDGKTYRHWWSLPDLERPATAVRFLETKAGPPELVVSCSNFAFYSFAVNKRQLTPWSEASGVPVSKNLPQELTYRNDYPIRITSNPAAPAKIMLGSFGAFALIDLEKKLPAFFKTIPEGHVRRRKRRRRSLSEALAGAEEIPAPEKTPDDVESTICLRYNSILHMDFIADNEMVVVEQPWLNVIATFPAALERKLYGS